MARPTLHKPEYDDLTFKYCLLGATDEKLALFFDVSVATINNWKLKHPSFVEAIKRGKHEADANVADSLYHRALGYSHPEEKLFQYEGKIIRAKTKKHYPPDTGAAFIWLKNRAAWRDKQDIEHSGELKLYGNLTDDEAKARIALLEAGS